MILDDANEVTNVSCDDIYNLVRKRKKLGITGARATTYLSLVIEGLLALNDPVIEVLPSHDENLTTYTASKQKKGGNTTGNTKKKRKHLCDVVIAATNEASYLFDKEKREAKQQGIRMKKNWLNAIIDDVSTRRHLNCDQKSKLTPFIIWKQSNCESMMTDGKR